MIRNEVVCVDVSNLHCSLSESAQQSDGQTQRTGANQL